ncbi:MAG: AGE family epimerase/isomerase [Saprospiraceae bacterium]|nr:AGE family epimerase/isomerase [Saprospiraceae bacterium]MDP4700092.1 AGE family epimerase/isomerase [Saprospiraceae bacterium]MDP5047894.1 AGE family epimerase/isomerase [Saprospiraceae bacterium]
MSVVVPNWRDFHSLYSKSLTENVIPFWEKYSLDEVDGGYFTCLLRDGNIFDTDKFIWLQAREVWMFAKLFNDWEANPSWLKIAIHGADFLEKYGRNENGDWYFSLRKDGKPLVSAYNIFSDCFAVMAFAQLAKASGEDRYAQIAIQSFERILQRQSNPKGKFSKAIPENRALKNFALPMILCNLALELESLSDSFDIEALIDTCVNEVMVDFYNEEYDITLENVKPDGSFSDTFEGRCVNPGHVIESMWFIMDIAERRQDKTLMKLAVDRTIRTLSYGWDKKYGGILYFMDVKNYPPQALEWDQKLWWVHVETLIALLKGYHHTGDSHCLEWFNKVHEYTWSHFPDPEFGEWFGYLNRQGEVLLPLKGGKWKGCFHVPRGLFQCSKILAKLANPVIG